MKVGDLIARTKYHGVPINMSTLALQNDWVHNYGIIISKPREQNIITSSPNYPHKTNNLLRVVDVILNGIVIRNVPISDLTRVR